ncbi:DUF7507 domain-containing protein [Leucobacter insecticola]|uniref:DUF7507 domain-containing protein n=1 Tax=Leucobacter insecticola TaxID=2714934 RepID=UPI001FCAB82A|nr:hypothetical protein [Leucobacter insecticola]
MRDAGEPPLAGVSVELLQNSKVVETVKTGKDGVYTFAGIYVDEYALRVDESSLPETTGEWMDTSFDAGTPAGSGGPHDFGFRNQIPGLSLQVEGNAPDTVAAGELVTWNVTLTNSGNVDLSMIDVVSELQESGDYEYVVTPDPGAMNHLAPGASVQLSATSPLTQEVIDAGEATNPVTASGYSQVPDRINTVEEEGVVTLAVTPRLDLSVGGALDNDADTTRPGDKVTVEIVISNTGNQTITGAEITSPTDGMSDITIDGWPGDEKVLLPGQSVTGTATVTVTQDDIDAGKISVDAVTSGTSPKGSAVTQDGSTTVDLVSAPTIDLAMTSELDPAGDAILYSLSSTNTGNQTLEDVALSHSLASELTVAWPGKDGMLAPGETATVELRVPFTDAMRGTDVLATALSEGTTRLGVAVNATASTSNTVPAVFVPDEKTVPQVKPAPELVEGPQGLLAVTGAVGAVGVGVLGSMLLLAGAILALRKRRQDA